MKKLRLSLEPIIYYGILFLFFKFLYVKIAVLICLAIRLIFEYKNRGGKEDGIDIMQELSSFKNLVESGASPSYAYRKLNLKRYPEFFISPLDENFSYRVFEKQYDLFKKRVFLVQEIKSKFLPVKIRMLLMKYIPLFIMFTLKFAINIESPILAYTEFIVFLGFIFTDSFSSYLAVDL